MLRMRRGKRAMKAGVKMRMKPASSTSSAPLAAISSARRASKASRVACALWSTTFVASPCVRAQSRPAASGRLEITARTSRPVRASTIARMLLPRPEIRMTPDFTSNDHGLGRTRLALDDGAHFPGLHAVRGKRGDRGTDVGARDHHGHADAAVERALHLGFLDVAVLL